MSDTTIISVQGFHTTSYGPPDQWRVTVSSRSRAVAGGPGRTVSTTKHAERDRAVHLAESMANLLDLLGQPFELRVAGELARKRTAVSRTKRMIGPYLPDTASDSPMSWYGLVIDTRTGQQVAACLHRHRKWGAAMTCARHMAHKAKRGNA